MTVHFNANKKLRVLFYPLILITKWLGRNYPETLIRIRYFVRFHKVLDLKHPKTLNEKILWLSFKTDTSEWTRLSDKNAVRDYVKEIGLEDILIPQYGYYTSAKNIDFTLLPNQFVIKTTHGCGDVMIVTNKLSIDANNICQYFAELLKHRYGELEGGKHYMRIVPGLTIEALLENDSESAKYSSTLIDYKFWCFNGEPCFCLTCCNRDKKGVDLLTYDQLWNAHPEYSVFNDEYRHGKIIPCPKNYDMMLDICRKLSKNFPCVRVDLYNLNGKIYFGEMTFTSLGGLMNYYTNEWLLKFGSQIILPI